MWPSMFSTLPQQHSSSSARPLTAAGRLDGRRGRQRRFPGPSFSTLPSELITDSWWQNTGAEQEAVWARTHSFSLCSPALTVSKTIRLFVLPPTFPPVSLSTFYCMEISHFLWVFFQQVLFNTIYVGYLPFSHCNHLYANNAPLQRPWKLLGGRAEN